MQSMRGVLFARRTLVSMLVSASLLAGALAGGLGAAASAATTATARPVKPTCSTITPKMIKQYLKLTVSAPRTSTAGGATDFLCEYGDKVSNIAVVIEYNVASTVKSFTGVKDQFDNNNEPTSGAGKNFGSLVNLSFSASLGSGKMTYSSVVTLQKALMIDIASSASVADLVALMKVALVLV
jgi:hypothetical protein